MSGSRVGRRRVVGGAMALFAVCLGSGCDGCSDLVHGRRTPHAVAGDYWSYAVTRTWPRCDPRDKELCDNKLTCPAFKFPRCYRIQTGEHRCVCSHARFAWARSADGGISDTLVECVLGLDGGILCGEVGHDGRMRDGDGGIILDPADGEGEP
jgi:hypothetical protein